MYKKVGIASLIMMSSVFLSRVFGIVREMIIAYLAGTSSSVDAYQISFIIPEILNHVLASGFLSITFIPIFTKYLSANKEEEAWRTFSNIMCSFSLLLLVLAFFAIFFTGEIIAITGITDPVVVADAIRMTRIIIPAQLFFFMGGLLMAVQFANERFLIPALAPLVYNGSIILSGLFLFPLIGMEGFSWGVLIGAFLGNFGIQWIGAKKIGMKLKWHFNFKHPDLRKYIALTLPLMLGLTVTFSTEIFPKVFGSYLSSGSVASFNYGLRIMFLLVGLFGQAVGVASYPYLSQLAAKNKIDEMNNLLNTTLRHIALVIPFSILIVVLRVEIVSLIFQRGRFDISSTNMTANILVCLMIGAFGFTAQTIVNRGYYALQNTLFPTIYVSAAVILTLPLYYLGMQQMGIYGVALALSVSTITQVVLLFIMWNRKSGNTGSRSVYLAYLKIIVLSVIDGALLYFAKEVLLSGVPSTTLIGCLINLICISILFCIVTILLAYIFRVKEIFEVTDKVIRKLKRQ